MEQQGVRRKHTNQLVKLLFFYSNNMKYKFVLDGEIMLGAKKLRWAWKMCGHVYQWFSLLMEEKMKQIDRTWLGPNVQTVAPYMHSLMSTLPAKSGLARHGPYIYLETNSVKSNTVNQGGLRKRQFAIVMCPWYDYSKAAAIYYKEKEPSSSLSKRSFIWGVKIGKPGKPLTPITTFGLWKSN